MDVSVVTITDGTGDRFLLDQLLAVSRADRTGGSEVVFVGPAAPPVTAAVTVPVRWVRWEAPTWAAAEARNAGARAASGDRLLFCRACDVVGPEWITTLSATLEQWAAAGGWCDDRSLNPGREDWRDVWDPAAGLPSLDPLLPRHATSANFAVRRETLLAIGGFAPEASPCDDVAASFALAARGTEVGFAADAVVACRHSADWQTCLQEFTTFGWGVVGALSLFDRAQIGLSAAQYVRRLTTWIEQTGRSTLSPVALARTEAFLHGCQQRLLRLSS